MIRLALLILLTIPLFAGQSVAMNNRSESYFTDPARVGSNPIMVEFQLHGWTLPASFRRVVDLGGSGFLVDLTNTSLQLGDTKVTDTTGGTPVTISLAGRTNVLVRYRRDYANATATYEVWNVDGSGYVLETRTLTGTKNPTVAGGTLNTVGAAVSLGFLRVSSTLVPAGSRPPTTFGSADIHDYKFDGNTTDETGVGTWSGTFSFESTPNQDVVVSVPKVSNTPAWAPFRPIRAGHADTLDGSQSYTMADDSATASCLWIQLSGPTTLQFSSRTSCTPTVTGAVFGSYSVRLVATSSAGGVDVEDLEFGAVAYDDNGVVIYPDERLLQFLGPIKVFTSNPWEWADNRLWTMLSGNWAQYEINGGTWLAESTKNTLNGTPRNGTAYVTNNTGVVYGVGTNFLDVFTGGRAGPVQAGSEWLSIAIESGGIRVWRPLASCQSQTQCTMISGVVWQRPTIASPGSAWGTSGYGNLVYGAGTVYTSAGQPTKLFGVGTNLQAEICDGDSTPDPGTTGLRIYEATTVQEVTVTACNSATELTLSASYAGPAIASPGAKYQFYDDDIPRGSWGPNLAVTINYYDLVAAYYRLWLSSGSTKARDAARWLADNWFKSTGVTGFRRSQAWLGLAIRAVVDDGTFANDMWAASDGDLDFSMDFAKWRAWGLSEDIREDAYVLEAIALAALYDTNATRRAKFIQRLKTTYDNQWGPDIEPGGWYQNLGTSGDDTRVVTVTNGSATVNLHSGSNFSADYCGVASSFYSTGTLGLTNGSTSITLSGGDLTAHVGKTIFIRGTLGGQPYSQVNRVQTATTLRFPWPGATGNAVAWRAQTYTSPLDLVDSYVMEVMPVNSSGVAVGKTTPNTGRGRSERDNWYWCTVTSGTQLTLDKPYTGDSTNPYRRLIPGGQSWTQPFIHAIVARSLLLAGDAAEAVGETAYATNYRARANSVINWLLAKGTGNFDYGFPYVAEAAYCEPESSQPNVCTGNDNLRSYIIEMNEALARWYELNPTVPNKAAIDAWYTAQFARTGFATPFPGDGEVATTLLDGQWNFGQNFTKAPGQTFGLGGASMWPATREGGPAAVQNRTLTVQVGSPLAYGDRIRVTAINASGVAVTNTCEAVTCSVTSDFRAGEQLVAVDYYNGSTLVSSGTQVTRIQ